MGETCSSQTPDTHSHSVPLIKSGIKFGLYIVNFICSGLCGFGEEQWKKCNLLLANPVALALVHQNASWDFLLEIRRHFEKTQ